MEDPVHVFVPTRGRSHRRITLNEFHLLSLHRKGVVRLTVLVPECEKHLWEEEVPTHVVPDDFRFEDIRQHIADHFVDSTQHFVMDDDLIIYRKTGKTTKERITDEVDVEGFFNHMKGMMQRYKHGGVATVSSHHFSEVGTNECERVQWAHFYDRAAQEHVRYTDAPEYEDMHMTLSLIKTGVTNGVSYHYVLGSSNNSSGGCSRYRTLETQNGYAMTFHNLHPKYVRLMKPKYSTVWKGEKISVRVSWKKALRDALRECEQ